MDIITTTRHHKIEKTYTMDIAIATEIEFYMMRTLCLTHRRWWNNNATYFACVEINWQRNHQISKQSDSICCEKNTACFKHTKTSEVTLPNHGKCHS